MENIRELDKKLTDEEMKLLEEARKSLLFLMKNAPKRHLKELYASEG